MKLIEYVWRCSCDKRECLLSKCVKDLKEICEIEAVCPFKDEDTDVIVLVSKTKE